MFVNVDDIKLQHRNARVLCDQIMEIGEEKHYTEYTMSLVPEYLKYMLKGREEFKIDGITRQYKQDRSLERVRAANEAEYRAIKIRRQACIISSIAAAISITSLLLAAFMYF